MSTEQEVFTYTCNYGPYKMFDESGKEIEVNRTPANIYEEIDIEELRKFVRSVEIKAFKHFSEKIEKILKNKSKINRK
jgi:hypothetical protein